MQVVSSTPFRVATLLWQPAAGAFAISVLCKATFQLRAGESTLAPEQEALQKEDVHWGHDPMRSLRVGGDLAPMKPRADVVLTGHAFAPGKAPVRSLTARLAVADVDKSIDVVCQRYYDAASVLHDGPPFVQMPLAYERAAAGRENPAGMRPGARDAQGRVELPNLLPQGQASVPPADAIAPVGFGPIAWTWPLRLEKLGRHGQSWNPAKWYHRPLEADFDFSFFNFAPPDQRPAAIREDERIVLENLHPDHPIFVTCLPGIQPVIIVELPGTAPFPLSLRCDTLAIHTDTLTCTLVWRAHFPVSDPRADGRVVVTMETSGRAGGQDIMAETAAASPGAGIAAEQAVPFQPGAGGPPSALFTAPPSSRPKRSGDTMSVPVYPGPHVQTPPVSVRGPHAQSTPPLPPPPVGAPPAALPPVTAPPAEAAPVPLTIGQALAAAQASASAGPAPSGPPIVGGVRQPELLAAVAGDDAEERLAADVGSGGVLAASNAAVGPADQSFGAAQPARAQAAWSGPAAGGPQVLRLAWLDLDGVPRLRRKPEYKAILDELAKRPPDRDADHARIDESPAEIEDRREVMEVLLKGVPVDAEGVRHAVNEGIRDDGRFVPQVVLLACEVEMTFDAVETLKALLPVAAAFAATPPASLAPGSPDALSAAVAGATTFLNTPGFPSPIIADTLAGRVRNAFVQTRKGLKAEALDGPAERVLLEARLYRKRPVFGDVFVRALAHVPGSGYAVPAYFPEAAAKKLPLHKRLRARLLAETHLAADPTESHPAALRVLAIAEVLPGGKR